MAVNFSSHDLVSMSRSLKKSLIIEQAEVPVYHIVSFLVLRHADVKAD